jgi:YHS domain-containing protein
MGGKIKKGAAYYDHDGKRIYVCCPACIKKLKANPKKYIKELEDAGVTLAKVPPVKRKK